MFQELHKAAEASWEIYSGCPELRDAALKRLNPMCYLNPKQALIYINSF